jgi:hypothetical protein
VTLTLAPGGWTVRADAALGGIPFGSGEAGFRIAGGGAHYVTITMTSFFYTTFTAIYDTLASAPGGLTAADPVPLPVSLDLSTGWIPLLTAIQSAGKYVALDLSACTMGGGTEFDPDSSVSTGKNRIVSLILPNTAVSIKADTTYSNPTFDHFSALKRVEGKYVETIGENAFGDCTDLSSVNFPAAQTIGEQAFDGCTGLGPVSLPAAQTIGRYAFNRCTGLGPVSLPLAQTIGARAFYHCTSLISVSLPAAQTIGDQAFDGCTDLGSISLPAAQTIDWQAFYGCTGLSSVSLPAAQTINWNAFGSTGITESLTITLGGTPPKLGTEMFTGVSGGTKTVTVNVPSAAFSAYGPVPANTTDDNWGNAFRGKGWNGSVYFTGTVNGNVSLAFTTY